jgi:hypothetical protein
MALPLQANSATVTKEMLHEVHQKMNLNIDTVKFHLGFEACKKAQTNLSTWLVLFCRSRKLFANQVFTWYP